MNTIINRLTLALTHATAVLYVLVMFKQFFSPEQPMMIVPFHVFMTLGLVFLFKPLKIRDIQNATTRLLDIAAYAVCMYLVWHYFQDVERLQLRFQGVDDVFFGETLAFWVGIPLLLEGVRRTAGWALIFIVSAFLIYGFGVVELPGWLYFSGFEAYDFIEITTLGTEGLFGVAANAMVTMVFFFVVFGVVFSNTGGGNIFIDLSLLASGRYAGGAAKSAIVASSLFGTVSGSAVANVTSTGVLTIPLMKRTGYSPEQAAATEAVASTGGQLMPPIMGVAAFVMADLLGIPYIDIAIAGIIPALGYYVALFISVDLLARRTNIGSVNYQELKDTISPIKPRIHLLLAPIAIISCLFAGYSVSMSAVIGILTGCVVPMLRKGTRYHPKELYNMVIDSAAQMASISVAVSVVGVIIAVSIQSGIAISFVSLLAEIGSGNLLLSLILVIAGCLTLGMGLPTVAAYIISAVIFVPALTQLGIEPLAAHFFVLYYSVLSMITPPVCLAAFAAAGISKSNPNKTGVVAFVLALVIFILPFGFVTDLAILGQGSLPMILAACFGVLCATSSWAIAIQGWLGQTLNKGIRLGYALLCILIISQSTLSALWILGVIIFMATSLYLLSSSRKRKVLDVTA
ncbi:TRAP transporter permease [Thaumasiovibrio sp. DFM-14]|uniref:TRAP transporter permease n=1 Tax=Thaumasiovibrio sp. DFM-14 TaxID=3384792 RepID=UPI0039A2F4CE